mmetsp:Transcript_3477/g.14205  ORF Transcript_3477/g.14205 Transcript_3477/m.14205 type:complete len:384 (+) Transcript_3477:924-2075(+)
MGSLISGRPGAAANEIASRSFLDLSSGRSSRTRSMSCSVDAPRCSRLRTKDVAELGPSPGPVGTSTYTLTLTCSNSSRSDSMFVACAVITFALAAWFSPTLATELRSGWLRMAILRRALMIPGTFAGSTGGAPGEAYCTKPTAADATHIAEQNLDTHNSPGPGPSLSCAGVSPSRGTCSLGRNALRLLRSSSLATSATSSSGAIRGWPSSDVAPADVVFGLVVGGSGWCSGWWFEPCASISGSRGGPSDDQDASLRLGWYSGEQKSSSGRGSLLFRWTNCGAGGGLAAASLLALASSSLRRSSAASSSSLRLRAARACSRCCCASSFERSTADDLCMSSASDTTRRRSALSGPTRGASSAAAATGSSAPWPPPSRRLGWRRCS